MAGLRLELAHSLIFQTVLLCLLKFSVIWGIFMDWNYKDFNYLLKLRGVLMINKILCGSNLHLKHQLNVPEQTLMECLVSVGFWRTGVILPEDYILTEIDTCIYGGTVHVYEWNKWKTLRIIKLRTLKKRFYYICMFTFLVINKIEHLKNLEKSSKHKKNPLEIITAISISVYSLLAWNVNEKE